MAQRIFTVPNQLTFLRLGFIPFFIVSVFYDRYDWALTVLLAAAVSDALDGLLARRLNQKTALGAYLDPIADKLLMSSSFLVLAMKGKLGWWLAILVLSRDVLILAVAAAIILVAGYRPFPPSMFGKGATVAQVLLVFAVVAAAAAEIPALDIVRDLLIYAVAALTVLSGLHYSFIIARRVSS